MMAAALACRCRGGAVRERAKSCFSGAARLTATKSPRVFRDTEIDPRITKPQKALPLCLDTNCGMKDRKNRAVLGLRASVTMPCRKDEPWPAATGIPLRF